MSNIVGRLIFDIRRNGIIDGNDYGIGNVPIVLQNISTNERLAVYTTSDGTYEFTDVPLGDYRIILVDGYEGTILTSPANFEENTQVGETPTAKLPPYTILKGPYPIETNTLNAVTPTTVFITVSDNTQNTAQTIFVGPARYEPLVSNTLDKCASVSNINLLQAVDNGTFGEVAPGTQPDGGPIVNPYPDIAPGFTFRPQYREINDGYYTIGNTIDPYPLFEWWRLSDHTTSIETGLMEIVNGANPGAIFFTTDVNISENTDYLFSAWVININNAVLDPPAFSVEILNEIGEIIFFENIGVKLDASSTTYMERNWVSI